MKKNIKLSTFITAILGLAAAICLTVYSTPSHRAKVYTVDLGRVLNAEAFLSHKADSSPIGKPWLANVKEANKKLQSTISQIAGKRSVVLVAPAVIQGGTDITDQVLVALGLPENVPATKPPMESMMLTLPKNNPSKEKTVPKWMAP